MARGSRYWRAVGAVMDIADSKKAFQEIKVLKDELYKENIVLREEVENISMFEEVVGTSPALQRELARAAKVAPTLLWNREFDPLR